jgi:hypothetical protein
MRLYAVHPYLRTRLSVAQAAGRRTSNFAMGTAVKDAHEHASASAFGMVTG